MEAVLCFLKFALFSKKLQKMKMSIIILVSGFWAAPGAHLGGPNYGSCLAFFEICIIFEKVAKNENVNNHIGIWTLGGSRSPSCAAVRPTEPRRAKRAPPPSVRPSRGERSEPRRPTNRPPFRRSADRPPLYSNTRSPASGGLLLVLSLYLYIYIYIYIQI